MVFDSHHRRWPLVGMLTRAGLLWSDDCRGQIMSPATSLLCKYAHCLTLTNCGARVWQIPSIVPPPRLQRRGRRGVNQTQNISIIEQWPLNNDCSRLNQYWPSTTALRYTILSIYTSAFYQVTESKGSLRRHSCLYSKHFEHCKPLHVGEGFLEYNISSRIALQNHNRILFHIKNNKK